MIKDYLLMLLLGVSFTIAGAYSISFVDEVAFVIMGVFFCLYGLVATGVSIMYCFRVIIEREKI